MALRSGFTLGSWTIYPLEGRLDNGEAERRIQPKTMDVLLCLADAAGAVVERESLLTAVWGEGAVGRKNTIRAMASPIIRCYPPYPSEGTAGILPGSVRTRYDLLGMHVRGRLQHAY